MTAPQILALLAFLALVILLVVIAMAVTGGGGPSTYDSDEDWGGDD